MKDWVGICSHDRQDVGRAVGGTGCLSERDDFRDHRNGHSGGDRKGEIVDDLQGGDVGVPSLVASSWGRSSDSPAASSQSGHESCVDGGFEAYRVQGHQVFTFVLIVALMGRPVTMQKPCVFLVSTPES